MKGIVFSEFMEMLEEKFPLEMIEEILEEANLPSGGAYTAVGTYDYQEMITLVTLLSKKTGLSPAELQKVFGQHLFSRLAAMQPRIVKATADAFSFLEQIENVIHTEVRKLYPDAELPRFEYHRPAPNSLEMTYQSPRPFADLAEGLIIGCLDHFKEKIDINRQDVSLKSPYRTKFTLTKAA